MKEKTNIGLVVFNEDVVVSINITADGGSKPAIVSALRSLKSYWKPFMRTYTEIGINQGIQLLKEAEQVRNFPKMLLLVTDGRNTHGRKALKSSIERLKKENINTFCVGVGPWVDYWELRYITKKDRVFLMKNFDDLTQGLYKIASKLCDGEYFRQILLFKLL